MTCHHTTHLSFAYMFRSLCGVHQNHAALRAEFISNSESEQAKIAVLDSFKNTRLPAIANRQYHFYTQQVCGAGVSGSPIVPATVRESAVIGVPCGMLVTPLIARS